MGSFHLIQVVDLEEQLRIVTTQRKKAEKATAEVLAILESQGVDYLSEPEGIDSSSDQDEVEGGGPTATVTKECECDGNSVNANLNSKVQDETSKSNGSTVEKSEVEDAMSGSEADGQVVVGSLSWKGRSKSPDSQKKHRAGKHLKQIRPRHIFYFTSPDPSPKYQMGKSCRKIKPKDLRYYNYFQVALKFGNLERAVQVRFEVLQLTNQTCLVRFGFPNLPLKCSNHIVCLSIGSKQKNIFGNKNGK